MRYGMTANALKQYQQVKTEAAVTGANAHRLIQMLFEGALERIASAKGHLQRGEITRKGELIGKAIAIVGGLRNSLNIEAGGEIARNLDLLYDYMQRRLLEGNIRADIQPLDEVVGLLREIKSAWDEIGVQCNTKPS